MEMLNQYSGFLLGDFFTQALIGSIALVFLLGYIGAPYFLWIAVLAAMAIGFGAPVIVSLAVFAVFLILGLPPVRQMLISNQIMGLMKSLGVIPKISETERTALEAGVVWNEAELFSGKPNAKNLFKFDMPKLSAEEQAFLDGPVEELCNMLNEWEMYQKREIPNSAFQFMKDKGFLGMIIPKEYGGLGFSANAHSRVVMKVSARSIAASTTIMVPNSLGPAELLVHYGTQAQKDRYLRRLATGEEVPCFGLTEPQAGSDAGAITSEGILFRGEDGEIYVRLNWKKRWITLAAISTLIGLAFRLRDPENLLGKGEDLGITCGLIPTSSPGVDVGRRHDPLGVPFYNCPTNGKNVVLKAEDTIIGGLEGAGRGWKMLMESLGAGRGISLPAQSAGGIQFVTRVASNHAVIRKQFGLSIGKFEGVEEPLARIGGANYYMEAMRQYTLSALDNGIAPPVVTAMAKYTSTEEFRKCINDGMDVLGGAGISLGERNLLGIPYMSAPISITVEGANILTRTLIVFGQGALRAHPFAFKEVDAIEKGDGKAFDAAFWGHIGHVVRNLFRSIVLSFTRGRLAPRGINGKAGRYMQKLAWASASYAILADIAMGTLGGKLKVKEKITGRFADALAWMYIATSTMKRYQGEGYRKEDWPLFEYSMKVCFSKIQIAFEGIFANFEGPLVGPLFRGPVKWWASLNRFDSEASDELGHKVVQVYLQNSEQRDRLTDCIYLPEDAQQAMGRLEKAFKAILASQDVSKKVKKAIRKKDLPKKSIAEVLPMAVEKSIITQAEYDLLKEAEELRWDAIQVDDFNEEQYRAVDLRSQSEAINKAKSS